ncbi:hypothetical protein AMK59_799 [Oryctes borbonicus]|uniref:THAP-type domain-containing protein n=1 Tax=Oryctes borbonicus TaxID=1629725 RepID=A0A0T6BBI8_9SCAR|nr:hypothetical protein AMK59_799 [Oryctes borbonicus]
MGLKKCCVPGCGDKKSVRRKFPIYDEEVYNIWLQRIGNMELYAMDPEKLGKKKFVCNSHFSIYCQQEGSQRLMYQSLPTINVPGFQGESNLKNSLFPYFSGKVSVSIPNKDAPCQEPQPSTSGLHEAPTLLEKVPEASALSKDHNRPSQGMTFFCEWYLMPTTQYGC